MLTCRHTARALQRLLGGRLSDRRWQQLRTHVRHCDPCLRQYETALHFERALHGAVDRPSPDEIRRHARRFFDHRQAVVTPAAATTSRPPTAIGRWVSWLTWRPVGLATAAALLVFVFATAQWLALRPWTDALLTARNGFQASGWQAITGARLWLVRPDDPDQSLQEVRAENVEGGPTHADARQALAFALTNLAERPTYSVVLGFQAPSSIVNYWPRHSQEPARLLVGGNLDLPQDRAIDLGAPHESSALVVLSLFSPASYETKTAEACVLACAPALSADCLRAVFALHHAAPLAVHRFDLRLGR